MGTHSSVSALTALGTTGVKTLIDTMVVPQGVSRIIGIWSNPIGGGTLTTGQPISGIVELESQDMAIIPLQLPMDAVDILTSGTTAFSPRIIPVDIPVTPGARLSCYMTLDLTNTGTLKGRVGLIYGS